MAVYKLQSLFNVDLEVRFEDDFEVGSGKYGGSVLVY
jgi:hypothetical protein